MRRHSYDLFSVVLLLAAGLGLVFLPESSDEALPTTDAVTVAGFLLAVLVVLSGVRPRVPPSAGFAPLTVGLLLLAVAAALPLIPGPAEAAARRIGLGRLSAEEIRGVLLAVGAFGLALGFSVWARRLVDRFVRAEQRENALTREMGHLGQKLKSQAADLRDLDITDELTGVLNRRAFLAGLGDAVKRDARLGEPMGFILVRVVDHGPDAERDGRGRADRMRVEVARALRNTTRGTDLVGRLGADEFAVLLGECQDPRPATERLLFALEGSPGARKKNPVRVQLGVVSIPEPKEEPAFEELMSMAERLIALLPDEATSQVGRDVFHRREPSRATG